MSSVSGSEYISIIEMRTSQRYEVAYAQRTWTDFCRKELREKVGVKVRFIIGVSQRTRTDFFLQTKHRTYLHGPIFFRSYCVWQWQARSHCWITPLRLFIGLKSAHTSSVSGSGYISIIEMRMSQRYEVAYAQRTWTEFCRKQLREKIGPSFYRTKSQRTRTDFHSEFLSTIKNRSVCAGHY